MARHRELITVRSQIYLPSLAIKWRTKLMYYVARGVHSAQAHMATSSFKSNLLYSLWRPPLAAKTSHCSTEYYIVKLER